MLSFLHTLYTRPITCFIAVCSVCITLLSAPISLRAQVAIIVNKSVKITSLEPQIVADIFTLNVQKWDNGLRICVFDWKGINRIKENFYKYLDITPDDMKKIWLKKQFSGKGLPPYACESEADVIERVASTPGAISYVSTTAARSSNKVAIVAEIR